MTPSTLRSPHVLLASLLAACAALPTSAFAVSDTTPQVVLTDAVIPYLNADSTDDDTRKSCDWNKTTVDYLVKESKGRVLLPGSGSARRSLALVTQTMRAAGGGFYSGPKWVVIEGKLSEDGKLIGSFEARRQTIRGSLGSCPTVRDLGQDVADDILQWLDKPGMDQKLGDAK